MPEDNNTSNNQNVAWWFKPTSDTIDFIKGIPVNVLADPDNVKVFDNYVKIKSGGLNMVIPIVEAAGGRKAWDEAIARGAGDVVQDLAVGSATTALYAWAFGSNPIGWGAVGVGAVVLGITWVTSANDMSFGAFLEQKLVNLKNNTNFKEIFLDNKVTRAEKFDIKNFQTNEEFSFDKSAHTATIQTSNQSTKEQAIEQVFEMKEIQTVTINNQTYNIKNLSNLELRNAIENIPQVSFLLSHILIKVGEYLDLGEKGIYKVKSGDTLSVIAQKNGMVTKDLVKLNPWLCDEGRIKFNQNKVLIEGDPLNLSNTNHTLYGETNADNLLIDANGGDNIFIGGYKKDIMQSKAKGYDKYFTNANDEITDNDGKGEVWYNSNQLLEAYKDNNKNDKYFYDNNGGYYEITNKGLKYTDVSGEANIKFINLNLLIA